MSVFMPVSGGFIRLGNKWVDEAFGFMLGWNFFLYGKHLKRTSARGIPCTDILNIEAVTIPFEIRLVISSESTIHLF